MSQPHIRIAEKSEHAALDERYLAWGYHGGIDFDNSLYVAELNSRPVGLVRRAQEDGLTLLRGMYVDPAHHREGVGSALLRRFVEDLESEECYCIPFAHLTHFYGRYGFVAVRDGDAPAALAGRTERYRVEGHDVLIMRRRRT